MRGKFDQMNNKSSRKDSSEENMVPFLTKYWAHISIAIIIITLAAFFIWPAIIQLLTVIIIIAGTGVAIVLAVDRNYRKYIQDHYSRIKLVRNAGLDVIGILLTIGCSIWLAGVLLYKLFRLFPALPNPCFQGRDFWLE
jgi:hypothetical protein